MPEDPKDLNPNAQQDPTQVDDNSGDGKPPEGLGDKGIKALQEERQNRKKLESELKRLKEQFSGIDPEKYTRLIAEQEQRELQEAEREKNFEKASQIKDKTIEELKQKELQLSTQYEDLRKQNALQKVYFKNRGRDTNDALLNVSYFDRFYRDFGSRFDLLPDGTLQVLNDQGVEAYGEDGKQLTIEAFFAQIKQNEFYGQMFEPDPQKSGTGHIVGKNGQTQQSFENRYGLKS